MYWIGIDNGTTGSIAVLNGTEAHYYEMPTKSEQSYTKSRQKVTRIDTVALENILSKYTESRCIIERPMVNPKRWKASASAIRALEATLIVLEKLGIPYQYIDSKEWQKAMLPRDMGKLVIINGVEKRKVEPAELKKASLDIARRLFPSVTPKKDGDSLLIAEYFRRFNLN